MDAGAATVGAMQKHLFDQPPPITPTDPNVHPDEEPRLSRQCEMILARLRAGPATNLELSRLALKYTSRISDLRAAGYNVTLIDRDHKTGRTLYALHGG